MTGPLRRAPTPALARYVDAYYGFDYTASSRELREGPGSHVVLVLSFGDDWSIGGERRGSFFGGLRTSQVVTANRGRAHGIHVDLVPCAARVLLGAPLSSLAQTTVGLGVVLGRDGARLVERLAGARDWGERFAHLDAELGRRLASAPPPSREIVWAWERLRRSHGRVRIGALAGELGWSRKRIVAAFRDEIGLAPKAAARLLRFERARALAGTRSWGELAFDCGYADQPHLIAEFRAFTGRSPETFLQDAARRRRVTSAA